MVQKHGMEYRKDAVRRTLLSWLTRKQIAIDLGISCFTQHFSLSISFSFVE